MKFHQYDFRWVDEQFVEIQASLHNKFGRKQLSIGDTLSLEVCSDPFCAGNRIQEIWKPCLERTTGKSKCEICKAREQKESFVFTIFDGFNQEALRPEERERISGAHMVYLAFFSPELIKVGVSKKDRQSLRQIEQGSFCTLFIAETPNGIEARQIETTLRKNGLQDKILGSQKKDSFIPDVDYEQAEKILRKVYDLHKINIKESPNLRSFLLENPIFKTWGNVYNIEGLQESKKQMHSVKLEKGEWVSGSIIAMKGSFLVLETPHELISLNMKNLNGYEIEFDKKYPGISLNSAMQSVLF